MGWGFAAGYVAVLSGIVGALIYKRFETFRRDAESYRRIVGEPVGHRTRQSTLTSPEAMAQAIEAIAIEVERISEGQRFVTKLLAEKRRPDSLISPITPIPGLSSR